MINMTRGDFEQDPPILVLHSDQVHNTPRARARNCANLRAAWNVPGLWFIYSLRRTWRRLGGRCSKEAGNRIQVSA